MIPINLIKLKMVNKYFNKKASMSYFQIAVLVISFFAFSYIIYGLGENEVFAQGISAFSNVCCEKTKSGESCQNAPPGQCDSNFRTHNGLCEETDYCRTGCCISPKTGLCDVRTPRGKCEEEGGDFEESELCQINECEKGCCVLGSEAIWTTEKNCEWEGNTENKDIPTEFLTDANHDSFHECIFSVERKNKGACVFESGDETGCVYITFEECNNRHKIYGEHNPNFYEDLFCSDKSLNTTCTTKEHKGCLENKEDVYWFDSCDNPEDVAEDCDLYKGSYCGEKNDNYFCKDVNCEVDGLIRKNGESWCEYDGTIGEREGYGSDPAGSRHIRHVCYLGTERIEPCSDLRNGICVEDVALTKEGDFSQAACRVNQWRSCLSYNGGQDSGQSMEKCKKNPDCFVKKIDMGGSFNFEVCLPEYPPGFDFANQVTSEGELNEDYFTTASQAEAICSAATIKCTSTWRCCLLTGCHCIDNCDCHTGKFTEEMNEFCTSLGDCGAYINYVGDYTEGGYSVKATKNTPPRIPGNPFSNEYDGQPAEPGNFEFYEDLNPSLLRKNYEDSEIKSNLSAFEQELLGVAGAYGSPLLLKILDEDFDPEKEGFVGELGMGSVHYATYSYGAASLRSAIDSQIVYEQTENKDFSMIAALIAGLIAYVITQSILAAMLAALFAFLFFICWIEYHHVYFTCMTWERPSGGDKCNECNKLDVPCTEYRCESLGELCHLINKGTGSEFCVSRPENTNYPNIHPLESVMSEGYAYENIKENGFEIKTEDGECINAYESIKFGIKIDPFAKCKFGDEPLKTYEEMPEFFGTKGQVILPIHRMTLFYPSPDAFKNQYNLSEEQIKELGQIEYYVKCKTASGKVNPDNYVIKSCVKPGPDLTAPLIVLAEPRNGAYVKYKQEEQDLKLYVNEPSECKWSVSEGKAFEEMENELKCETDVRAYTLYGLPCNTTLTELTNKSTFYFKCKDQPWFAGTVNESDRNVMEEDYVYTLKTSMSNLTIEEIKPVEGETIVEGFEPVSMNLRVRTGGGAEKGNSQCYYKFSDNRDYIRFFKTNSSVHEQKFSSIMNGKYDVKIRCVDDAGNTAENSTFFKVKIDSFGPKITRIYYDVGLKVVTAEEAECKYDFNKNFKFENASIMTSRDGINHVGSWDLRTYYIQCEDEQGNKNNKVKVRPVN